MVFKRTCNSNAIYRIFSLSIIALLTLTVGSGSGKSEEKKPSPCIEDAMIVFDASGSMSGNQTLGIPNSQSTVNALVPAGKTPLTSAVEQAAQVLDFKKKPGVVVVVTDGEETCGRSPCALAKQLQMTAQQLTVHVIGFRYDSFSWTGESSVMDLMCLANENHGLYIKTNSEEELVEALEKTLDCPMVSQVAPTSLTK
jgi:Ca-activated chloride channel family protein